MSIKRKYFIHIGPPKTATTSLQDFFFKKKFRSLTYEGIIQPREKYDNSLCSVIYKISASEKHLKSYDFESLINKKLNSHISFLSEEMFLVESKGMSWKEKVSRLHKITSSIEPTIVIVLREPISAIRSYYQELYYSVDRSKITTIDDFAKSEYCDIYMYEKLISYLKNIGFNKLKILEFEKLINGNYTVGEIFNIDDNERVILSNNNISKKKRKIHQTNNEIKKSAISKFIQEIIKNNVNKKYKNKIMNILLSLNIGKGKKIDIKIDSEIENIFIKSYEYVLSSNLT